MISRKGTVKVDYQLVDDLIISLESQTYSSQSQQAQFLHQSLTLPFYFHQIYKYIKPSNLITFKRYDVLNDGLFILLKGQVSYMFNNQGGDISESSKMKNSGQKNASGTSIISTMLSVFQCSLKNCTAVQESYLLKIEEQQAIACKFYQLFNQRRELVQNHYLASDHSSFNLAEDFNSVFTVDLKIHSNFGFQKFTFRQTVSLHSICVISDGRVKMKGKQGSHQIQKFGVLLPGIQYQVTSATLLVMEIKNNQTLVIKISQIEPPSQKQNNSQSLYRKGFPNLKARRNNNRNNKMGKSACGLDMLFTKKEKAKREREVTKLSKESQSYSIISSYLCHRNLQMIQKQSIHDKNKAKREDRCRNPLILFNIVNEKSRLATPNFPNAVCTPNYEKVSAPSTRQKKIISEARNQINGNLLKKLKVPLKDYKKMLKRREMEEKSSLLRGDAKAKSLFTLTAGKHVDSGWQEQQFVRYDNP